MANPENSFTFLEYLKVLNPVIKLLIIWDGVSYHQYGETKDYLEKINKDFKKA